MYEYNNELGYKNIKNCIFKYRKFLHTATTADVR